MGGRQAFEALKAAWRREPRAVFVRLGEALRGAGELEEAAAVLRDGLDHWPQSLSGHVALARVLHDAGDLLAAEESLDRVLERDPEHWAALDLLAVLRCQAGKRAEEAGILRRLGRQAPGDRGIRRRLELAEAQIACRPAPPAPGPGVVPPPRFAGPRFQSMPTQVLGAAPVPPSRPPRVMTEPSAAAPTRGSASTTSPGGVSPRLLRRSEVLRTSPGHRPPQAGIPRASRPVALADPFANETMVELLVDQGRQDEARRLLVALIQREPGRRSLAQRLLELGGEGPQESAQGRSSPADLEGLMRGVLSSAAEELDALAGPAIQDGSS